MDFYYFFVFFVFLFLGLQVRGTHWDQAEWRGVCSVEGWNGGDDTQVCRSGN